MAAPVFTAAAITAILLCDRAMRSAGPTGRSGGAAGGLGGVLLLVGLALVLMTPVTPGTQAKQGLTVYCVVPLLFGLDLIWTALSRTRPRAMAEPNLVP